MDSTHTLIEASSVHEAFVKLTRRSVSGSAAELFDRGSESE